MPWVFGHQPVDAGGEHLKGLVGRGLTTTVFRTGAILTV